MSAEHDFRALPDDLPVPVDDGAADDLPGSPIPVTSLEATEGPRVDLRAAPTGTLLLYVYPRTGVPGEPPLPGWDEIPGARGCTPQNCAFRDLHAELAAAGARVYGLSSQPLDAQRDFAARERMPYPLLNDSTMALERDLGLPTFETSGLRLYRRLTLIARESRVEKVFYPVFPPGSDAGHALAWLRDDQR